MEKFLRKSPSTRAWLLLLPSAAWLLVFFVAPLFIVLVYSFMSRNAQGGLEPVFTVQNYARIFDPLYFSVFMRSLNIALITTLISLLTGYPLAYFIATRPARWRSVFIFLLVIPFWTNFLIRTYAWLALLRNNTGLINTTLLHLGLIQKPLALFGNDFAIVLGLVYGWLPDMVLPIYAALDRMDKSLVEAAHDLYADHLHTFLRVVWPLSLPGVIAGSMLVFIPSLGAFITPAILGGGKSVMIGNIINSQFLTARDWPFGSALSVLTMAFILAATLLYFRISARQELLQGTDKI